tara:strand:- start:42 stop:440 length:399 start_codon:yes stop_codon:yes gene_type:complete
VKITKQKLQQIISEELENTELNEFGERAQKQREEDEKQFPEVWEAVQSGIEKLSKIHPGLNMGYMSGMPNTDGINAAVRDGLEALRQLEDSEQRYMAAYQLLMNMSARMSNLRSSGPARYYAEKEPGQYTGD